MNRLNLKIFRSKQLVLLVFAGFLNGGACNSQSDAVIGSQAQVEREFRFPGFGRLSPTKLDCGIAIHLNDRVVKLPNIAGYSDCRCLAIVRTANQGKEREIAIVSVGKSGISSKDPNLDFFGDDPGECILIVDLQSETYERISYHQRRPDLITISPDGKSIAFASLDGWLPTIRSGSDAIDNKRPDEAESAIEKFQNRRLDKGLESLKVGTSLYSVWEIAPVRPLWEMRYYRKNTEAGRTAVFIRPWAAYARNELPWWADHMDTVFYKRCRIGFSNCSRYFIALDESHGVNILRVSDGSQFHCCEVHGDIKPVAFFFDRAGDTVSVICTDHSVRQFDLQSGKEVKQTKSLHQMLPNGARFITIDQSLIMQFAVHSPTGAIATSQSDKSLHLFRRSQEGLGWDQPLKVLGLGETSVCRIDFSEDRKWLGIGFNRRRDQRDLGNIRRYELVDLASAKIVKRINSVYPNERLSPPLFQERFADHVPTITLSTDFAPALSSQGSDVYFAAPLAVE